MACDADAAGLLAPDQNFALQHNIAYVLEADWRFVQLASVFFSDAVEHLRGGKGFHDIAWPAAALEEPAQQDGEDLVRVYEAAMLIAGADTVGVTVSCKS